MLTGIKQRAIVGEGGRIEIAASELPSGTVVEVIVLVEPEEQDLQDFMSLPLDERRRVLAQQAEQMVAHYEESAVEREAWQAGDFVEY